MLKNKILVIAIALILAVPVFAEEAESAAQSVAQTENVESVINNNEVEQPEVKEENNNEAASTPYKEPISKKKIAKKFLLAMTGVVLSSLAIYICLSLYNKIREGFAAQNVSPADRKESLEEPQDFLDSIKTFLDKTHWGE